MFIEILKKINDINELLFSPLDNIINSFSWADWIKDALIDSLHMVPFLFTVFFIIGFIEYFYSEKSSILAKRSKKFGPLFGSLLATVPQCGFSVIASGLYAGKIITTGTLLAVFLATSDEALPVLLAEPEKYHLILPLLGVKLLIALIAGYSVDWFSIYFKKKNDIAEGQSSHTVISTDEGCCHHVIHPAKKLSLWVHPVVHTCNIFCFILAVTLVINYAVMSVGGESNLGEYILADSSLQPIILALFGLIPNCAVSIAITLMYMKGAIGFGSVVAGLCSSAGLGLLVLLKKNNSKKDTIKIIILLFFVSSLSGLILKFLYN